MRKRAAGARLSDHLRVFRPPPENRSLRKGDVLDLEAAFGEQALHAGVSDHVQHANCREYPLAAACKASLRSVSPGLRLLASGV